MPVFTPRNPHVAWRGPGRSRRHLYKEALLPVCLNRGTPYPCSATKLQDATTPSRRPARRPISKRQASVNIRNQNHLGSHISTEEYQALCRLEDATLEVFAGGYWSPDLLIKAFCDLDLVFFGGHLRGHCHVQWKPKRWFPGPRRHGFTYGCTITLQEGKCMIVLCADGVFRDPTRDAFKESWRTLLHEMCHAYEFVTVSSREWRRDTVEHDRHFGTKLYAVHERARREIHVGSVTRGESYQELPQEGGRPHPSRYCFSEVLLYFLAVISIALKLTTQKSSLFQKRPD